LKTYGGAPPFLTSALDGSEWSASRPGRFIREKESPVPIGHEAGWIPEPSGRCEEKNPCPCRESNPGSPTGSLSLYRLRYPNLEGPITSGIQIQYQDSKRTSRMRSSGANHYTTLQPAGMFCNVLNSKSYFIGSNGKTATMNGFKFRLHRVRISAQELIAPGSFVGLLGHFQQYCFVFYYDSCFPIHNHAVTEGLQYVVK
jgi:hypothetical protein